MHEHIECAIILIIFYDRRLRSQEQIILKIKYVQLLFAQTDRNVIETEMEGIIV